MTSTVDRKYATRKFVNTAIDNAKIQKEKEKKEKVKNDETKVSRSMLPGKFLTKIKDSRQDKNDEIFKKMKRETIKMQANSKNPNKGT